MYRPGSKLYGNGTVTFTTRLTVEVQGVPYEKIEEFQQYIAKAGLVTGGTGSKVRPVVSCKGTTCQYGLIDTFALSEEIHHRFFEGYSSESAFLISLRSPWADVPITA